MFKQISKGNCNFCKKELIYFKKSEIKPNICIACYRILIEAREQHKGCLVIDGKLEILEE